MFWLAVQGLVIPIAISSLVVVFTVSTVRFEIKAKVDDTMGNKIKEFVSVVFGILYTMSTNLAGGVLLAKALQMIIAEFEKGVKKVAYKEIDESEIILINSVSSFIENIKKVKEKKESKDGTSTELYFRGQETEFWDIEPSIFRDDMLSIEHKLMQIPLQKSPTEFKDLNSMFDIMTKYQHYGMCTRLLDLTTNPLVALYFACKIHGIEKYITEDGSEVEKEPYGVIYYTDKYYPSQSTDLEIKIVSALASYDLEKENTLSDVLEKLYHDQIIDKETKDNWLENYKEFVEIIQNNYMVMPTYTNERLRKQSGVFLLTSLFLFNKEIEVEKSIISKAKGKLKEEFREECFYISGESKETILKELDLYNINEATLFPELEHQLSYIKCANRNQVNPVTDFTKYEEDSVSTMQDIAAKQPELDKYILDKFDDKFKKVLEKDEIQDVLNIIEDLFTIDWYKREKILSKMKMSITEYYFTKGQSKDNAKQKAEQIMILLNQIVEDFIMSANERGD